MKYVVLIVLWTAWCLIHSGMISLTVTKYLKRRLGAHYRFYRLFYNIVALTTLLPVLLYSQMLKGPVIYRWQGFMKFVQILFLAVAAALLIAGSLKYDMHHFIGIRQIKSGKSPAAISKSGEIDTSGILGVTRHPWYLGAIVFLWVGYRELYVSTLVVNVLLTVYLIVGTVLEKRKLIIEFGESYRNYMRRVSMLFPAKWLFSRLFAPVHLFLQCKERSIAQRGANPIVSLPGRAGSALHSPGVTMKPQKVVVNDLMQRNYCYYLTEPMGKNFDRNFLPQLTPHQMLEMGVFGGKYMTDCRDEFPAEWFVHAKLCHERHDPELNYFGVNASQPLSVWRKKGWIYHEDPRGWFQWYCRYYRGRRCPDDQRQINRWRAIRRHIAQIQKYCEKGDLDCRPKQRQTLLHWAYDSRNI